jgi:hypothetical protein
MNKIIYSIVSILALTVQSYAATSTKIYLSFPVGMFVGASKFGNAIASLKIQEGAEVLVPSVQFVETSPLHYRLCAQVQRDGGDFIKMVGIIKGEVIGVKYPRGTAFQTQNITPIYSQHWKACDTYLDAT